MHTINCWAVFGASALAFILQGVWYSPLLFGQYWLREVKLDGHQLARSNKFWTFFGSYFVILIGAWLFAKFIGPEPMLLPAILKGLLIGLIWVTGSIAGNYLAARRSLMLFLIDGGYATLQFAIFGAILGLFP